MNEIDENDEYDEGREALISEMVFDGALVFKGPVDLEKVRPNDY